MKLSLLLAVALLPLIVLGDHVGNRRRNGRQQRPVQVRDRQQRVNSFSRTPAVIPQAVPAAGQNNFIPQQASIPLPRVQVVPALGQPNVQLPRQPKTIDVEGTQFTNESPDAAGNYNFVLQSDEVYRQESGTQRQLSRDGESANEITGEVSWTAPNGELITFSYVANENGYQPSNLPQPPPVSPAIQRSLDLIARVNARNNN